MATASGKDGKVEVDSSEVAEVLAWQLTTTSNNPAHASSSTQGAKTRNAGVKDARGSIQFKLDFSNPITDQFDEGTKATLKLYLDATRFFTVPAIIDQIVWDDVDVNDGETIGGTANFSGTGPITKPAFA